MKKILLLSVLFLLTNVAMANEVLFANNSSLNPIEVTYQLCGTCPNEVIVVNKKSFAYISPSSDSSGITIVSAIEKNASGQIAAQGKFKFSGNGSHCGYPFDMSKEMKNSVAIILDDLNGSHTIACDAKGYI